MIFYQPQDGYCYNSDTLFLYAFTSEFSPSGRMLDVGCGCGVLGLLLARDLKIELVLNEIEHTAAALAEKNIAANGINATLLSGDFLEIGFRSEFDVVVSNPPFYSDRVLKSDNPSLKRARYNESLPLEPFFKSVSKALKNRGDFFFCYDSKQLSTVLETLIVNRLNPETLRFVHPKKDRASTIFLCHAKKDSKSVLKIVPPLYVFDNEKNTHEALEIFEKADTYSIKCTL